MGYYVGNSRKSIFHFKRTADIFFSAAARCIIRIVQFNIFMQKKGQKVNHSWLFITITGPVSVWLHVHILRLMWVYLCRSRGSHWAIQSQGQWIRFAAKRKAGEWSMEHERIDARAEERETPNTHLFGFIKESHSISIDSKKALLQNQQRRPLIEIHWNVLAIYCGWRMF